MWFKNNLKRVGACGPIWLFILIFVLVKELRVDWIELRIKKGMELTENDSNGFLLLGEMFNHCSSLVICGGVIKQLF